MANIEHPDITAALITGYPTFQATENQDSPENRADYIDDHIAELVKWLRMGHPDIMDEFIEMSGQICSIGYKTWLN